MLRHPESLADATFQPIMFVLLFAYVFGGAIQVPGGGSYREFLMGGIMGQTLVFSAFAVGIGVANDLSKNVLDRFRSLPISRSAPIGGYAIANLVKNVLPIVLMSITGLVVGWRIRGGAVDALFAYLLMFGFVFAMIWVGILLAASVGTPEGVGGVAFVVLFPLTFVSSSFVPVASMPGFLKVLAQWNPTTALADALRKLFGNPNSPLLASDPWPIRHPVLYSWIWAGAVVAICAPLAIRAYRKATED
jgi:ABC transporter DrrB family efflux protein